MNNLYEGQVRVHLYGQNALIPIYLDNQIFASVIGVAGSELIVKEHRYETIQEIRNSSSDRYPDGFLRAFNQPAQAKIRYDPEQHGLEIDLYEVNEASEKMEMPILWMGTLENNLMPAYEVEWEILKTVDENNTAFCALVKTQPVAATN